MAGVRIDAKRDHLIDHHVAENPMMALLRVFLGEKSKKQKDIAATNAVLGEMALCGPGLTEGALSIREVGIGMAEGVRPIFALGNRLHQFAKAKVAVGRSGVSGGGDRKADRTPAPHIRTCAMLRALTFDYWDTLYAGGALPERVAMRRTAVGALLGAYGRSLPDAQLRALEKI